MACVVAIFATISATATLIIGFINMGTFHATYLKTSVGIWCGLLMFAHVFLGLLMLGSRSTTVGILYFLVNAACLPFMIYGSVVAYEHHDNFAEFRKYNENGLCTVVEDNCRCSDRTGRFVFKNSAYTVPKCPLYSFGEDLWLTLFVLLIINAFWSLIGLATGFVSLCVAVMRKEKYSVPTKSMMEPQTMRAM